MLKLAIIFGVTVVLTATAASDPYAALTAAEATQLKPEIERWILDHVKHNWADMWKIQEQTPELKNELLLGRKDVPDMDQKQFVQAMQETNWRGIPRNQGIHSA